MDSTWLIVTPDGAGATVVGAPCGSMEMTSKACPLSWVYTVCVSTVFRNLPSRVLYIWSKHLNDESVEFRAAWRALMVFILYRSSIISYHGFP